MNISSRIEKNIYKRVNLLPPSAENKSIPLYIFNEITYLVSSCTIADERILESIQHLEFEEREIETRQWNWWNNGNFARPNLCKSYRIPAAEFIKGSSVTSTIPEFPQSPKRLHFQEARELQYRGKLARSSSISNFV